MVAAVLLLACGNDVATEDAQIMTPIQTAAPGFLKPAECKIEPPEATLLF